MAANLLHNVPVRLLLVSIPVWAVFAAIKLALAVVGLVTCLLASPFNTRSWPVLWVWGNAEDGGNPTWWQNRHPGWPGWFSRYVYTAIRNPVNNLRYWFRQPARFNFTGQLPSEIKRKDFEADDLLAAGMMRGWWYRWSGWKHGYRVITISDDMEHYGETVVGFKIGTGVPGCGFSIQVRRDRKIGH